MLTPSKLHVGHVDEEGRRLMDVSTTTTSPFVACRTDIEEQRVTNVDNSRPRADLTAEFAHAKNAFIATALPVAITMILSSLASVYVKSPRSIQEVIGGLVVYDITEDTTTDTSVKVGESMANALVIVAVIAAATVIVLFLFRMGCSPCLRCYMIFASFSILSILGGNFAKTVLDQYNVLFNWPSFIFVICSFSIIGVFAIFYPLGLPRILTHSYLICTSVLLAWYLSGMWLSIYIVIPRITIITALTHC